MKKSKKPKFTETEIIKEIATRTGLPINAVFQVVNIYHDIIMVCVNNGVEADMGDLGVMGWNLKPPRKGVVYYDIYTREPLPPKDVPGFWFPKFVPKRKWRLDLRNMTEFWEEDKKGENEEDAVHE